MPFTLEIGSKAVDFSLPGTDGKNYSLKNFNFAKGLVIFFTCNHCPYVIASDEITKQTALKFKDQGIEFVGINANSEELVPDDSFPKMVERMNQFHFPWTYLRDESQEIAKKYGAYKTPQFFLFDENRQLIYCGRCIDTPRQPEKMTVNDLENAIKEFLEGKKISTPLTNPIGCTVKWKGHDKHWMPPDACDLV